jgi:hypothetical protein
MLRHSCGYKLANEQVQSVLEGLRAAELRPILPEGAQGWQSCGDLAQESRVADFAPLVEKMTPESSANFVPHLLFNGSNFEPEKGGVRRQRADQATDVGGRACGISRHLDFPPFQDGRKNRHEIRAPILQARISDCPNRVPKTDLADCRPKKVGPFLGRSHVGDFRENSCAAHCAFSL